MKTLSDVQTQLSQGRFEFTRRAFKRAVERNISEQEIREASEQLAVIEDYPTDKYSPSCLLLGYTKSDRPLHLQVSLADSDVVVIITLYEPDETEWLDHRMRR
jgi:hypothetical protein